MVNWNGLGQVAGLALLLCVAASCSSVPHNLVDSFALGSTFSDAQSALKRMGHGEGTVYRWEAISKPAEGVELRALDSDGKFWKASFSHGVAEKSELGISEWLATSGVDRHAREFYFDVRNEGSYDRWRPDAKDLNSFTGELRFFDKDLPARTLMS